MFDAASIGQPVIVGPGYSRLLERIPLVPKGQGAFEEAWLQKLIHDSPECLPVGEIEPSFGRLIPICREMPVPGGLIDNLLMTGTGDIAIVETKLFRNPEARRQVVAQAMDYATCVFAMGYADFEKATLDGTFENGSKPPSLHAALPEAMRLDEAAFADAVSNNLRRGRALILIVGDGIRQEAENLVEGIQAHARFGFTLAMVELGVFGLPDEPQRFLIRPRTLAKTAIVHRTIVEVVGAGVKVREQRSVVPGGASTEAYWEVLESKTPGARAALEKLLEAAEPLGVYPEFLGTLNLKLRRQRGRDVNLGYISKDGEILTEAASYFPGGDEALGYPALGKEYVEDLAKTFGCEVRKYASGWTPSISGKTLRIGTVLNRLDAWLGPMERYIAELRKKDADVETTSS
jgi:hypothetical protein